MEARFLKHVDKNGENGCWLWTASTQMGYGIFGVDGSSKLTHRIAYELWKEAIPDGLCIRHKCDIPACVNPAHLEVGTHQDNMDDMTRAGRQARGEKHGNAKLTKEQVFDIRSRKGQTQRELAKEFGVSNQTISFIQRRINWKDI